MAQIDLTRRTKIVATIGPATSSEEMLEKIIHAGVDVCRLNFSHGAYELHQEVIDRVTHEETKLRLTDKIISKIQTSLAI